MSRRTKCRRYRIAAVLLPALALAGCNGREGDSRRVISVSLNADGIVYCIKGAIQRNAPSENRLRLEDVTVTTFHEPDMVRVTGFRQSGQGGSVPESYDIAFSVQNHIARAHVVATTARDINVNSPPVRQFDEALSRTLTTYALKDHNDGGIAAVRVEGKLLVMDVETPLR